MDRTRQQYLVSGNHPFGRVNLGRATASGALTKANELLQDGSVDVRICRPRGVALWSGDFDQLE